MFETTAGILTKDRFSILAAVCRKGEGFHRLCVCRCVSGLICVVVGSCALFAPGTSVADTNIHAHARSRTHLRTDTPHTDNDGNPDPIVAPDEVCVWVFVCVVRVCMCEADEHVILPGNTRTSYVEY